MLALCAPRDYRPLAAAQVFALAIPFRFVILAFGLLPPRPPTGVLGQFGFVPRRMPFPARHTAGLLVAGVRP